MNEQLEYGIKLKQLTIKNFRCFGELNASFDDKLTVFIAENGGGKTAILDAVAEGLKAYLYELGIDTTPCSFKEQDITVGRDAKTENEVVVELTYPVELGYTEEYVPDQVNEDAASGYASQNLANSEQDDAKGKQEAEVQESEMDSNTENEVKLLVDISQDGDSAFKLSSTSVVASFERHAAQRVNKDKDTGAGIILPVLLYIGGNSPELTEKKQDKAKNRISNIYEDGLSANRINFTAFFRWFESRYLLFIQEKANDPSIKLEAFDPELAKIKWAVEEMLNDDSDNKKYENLRIKYSKQGAKMVLGKKNDAGNYNDIEVKQLSSGEKALFALVADLGFRLLNAHPIEKSSSDVEDVAAYEGVQSINGKGIVLIDEVDLHLHPKWQRKIVGKLMDIFPDVQWVMTTHSPLILGGLSSKHIKVIDQGKVYDTEATFGREVDDILEIVMQVDAGEFTKIINKIARLISMGELEIAEQKLLEMKKEIDDAGDKGDEHPDVLRMGSLLDRKKVLGR